MDDWIKELERLTESTASRVEQMTHEELLQFVEDRGRLVDQWKQSHPQSVAGQAGWNRDLDRRVLKLLEHDGAIRARMQALLAEYGGSYNKVQKAKKQKTAYDVEYTPDSLFFDKKK